MKGRTTWYLEPRGVQADLDVFLACYNLERGDRGCGLNGRTPAQALREALGAVALPPIIPPPVAERATPPEPQVA